MARTADERREYLRAWMAEWRTKNRESYREYRRQHYAQNKEHISEWRKTDRASSDKQRAAANKRYAANQQKIRAREKKRRANKELREHARLKTAQWRTENPERAREACRNYQKAHPAAFQKSTGTRRARKLSAFVEEVDRDVVFQRDKGKCGICMMRVDPKGKWHIDHVIPLSKGGTHSYDNVQLAHPTCNQRKHAQLPKGQPSLFQVKT